MESAREDATAGHVWDAVSASLQQSSPPQPATKLTRVPTHFHHLEPRNEAAVAPGFVACKIHVSLYLCYSKTRIAPPKKRFGF